MFLALAGRVQLQGFAVFGVKHLPEVFQPVGFVLFHPVPLPEMKSQKGYEWVEISLFASGVELPQVYPHAQVLAVLILEATSFEVFHLYLYQRCRVGARG